MLPLCCCCGGEAHVVTVAGMVADIPNACAGHIAVVVAAIAVTTRPPIKDLQADPFYYLWVSQH